LRYVIVINIHTEVTSSSVVDERAFQERTIVEDPELGNEYKLYKIKVPYRIIPYIW